MSQPAPPPSASPSTSPSTSPSSSGALRPPVPTSAPGVLGTAALAGLALGVLDLLLQRTLPYPLADLANSSAVWALVAFLLGAWLRPAPGEAARAGAVLVAVAGAVSLVVAVQAYYLAAVVTDVASVARLTSVPTLTWMLFGVLAGAVFAAAGTWSRDADPARAALGLALPAAVLLAESWLRLSWGGTAVLTAALAGVVLATALGRPTVLHRAALLTVLLTPACYLAQRVAGY